MAEKGSRRGGDRWVGNQNVRVAQWRGVAHDVGVSMLATARGRLACDSAPPEPCGLNERLQHFAGIQSERGRSQIKHPAVDDIGIVVRILL